MAIVATVDTRFGTVVDAYCRISAINWNLPNIFVTLTLNIYLNNEARINDKEALDVRHYQIPLAEAIAHGENMIAFGYFWVGNDDEQIGKGTKV